MFSRIQTSLRYRAKWAEFGVYYLHSPKFSSVRIAGRNVHLSFPDHERETHDWEFGKIVFEDCYRLSGIDGEVKTVLDIGANIGLFAIAARQQFPKATIHCYEPNPNLSAYLVHHCTQIGATPHMAAIGATAGSASLILNDGSLYSTTASGGDIPQISFADAVSRLGSVDVLKLDCEGAEWDIFTAKEAWNSVRSLVMEYHLWAKQNATIDELCTTLANLGFASITIPPSSDSWGFAFATKT